MERGCPPLAGKKKYFWRRFAKNPAAPEANPRRAPLHPVSVGCSHALKLQHFTRGVPSSHPPPPNLPAPGLSAFTFLLGIWLCLIRSRELSCCQPPWGMWRKVERHRGGRRKREAAAAAAGLQSQGCISRASLGRCRCPVAIWDIQNLGKKQSLSRARNPFSSKMVRQLLGVLDPDTGTASTSGGEAVVGKAEGQKPFPNMLKGFASCLGSPPTSAQHKTASGCQSVTAPQRCQRGVIQSRITPGSSLVAPASFTEGSQQPLGTTQTFTRLEQDETRHRARPRGQQTDTDSECPWRKGFRRPPRRFWTIW